MRKKISFVCIIAILISFSLPVHAVEKKSDTVSPSDIMISAGGTGYSDNHSWPTSLHITSISGSGSRYNRYKVTLTAFQFGYYPENVKPVSSIRFNFRLVHKTNHTNVGSVIYLYNLNATDWNWVWDGYGYPGEYFAMKSNVTNYSTSYGSVTTSWYLYNNEQ